MKKSIYLFLILCCSILFTAHAGASGYTVSVNQFVEHPALDAVLKGMQDYLNEHDVNVEFKVHNAQANMSTANQIAQQMVAEKSNMMVAIATPSAQACAQAVKKAPAGLKRPLLFSAVTDPVAAGLVKNLKQPGGNISGVSDLLPLKKHMQMIFDFIPDAKKIGVMYNAGEANSKAAVESIKQISKEMGFKVIDATASKTAEVYQASKSLVGRVDAVFIPTDNTIVSALESVIKVGVENRMPVFAADVDSVRRGAAAAMGFDYYKHGYQTGAMVEKVLKGASPANMPVEFQEELQFQIHMGYAKKMGLTPPKSLVDKASKVYEK